MQVLYIIPGLPVYFMRPQMTHSNVWDSQKHQKLSTSINISQQHEGLPLFMGPLSVELTFYFPITRKSIYKIGQYHIIKPRLDDLIEFYLDVGNKILFSDSCIISTVIAHKKYDKETRTELLIKELLSE